MGPHMKEKHTLFSGSTAKVCDHNICQMDKVFFYEPLGFKTFFIAGFWDWGPRESLGWSWIKATWRQTWSWRAVQADRDTQKDKALRTGFLKKTGVFFTGR